MRLSGAKGKSFPIKARKLDFIIKMLVTSKVLIYYTVLFTAKRKSLSSERIAFYEMEDNIKLPMYYTLLLTAVIINVI